MLTAAQGFEFLGDLDGSLDPVSKVLRTKVSRFATIVFAEGVGGRLVVLKCLLPDELAPLDVLERRSRAASFNALAGEYHDMLKRHGVLLAEPCRMVVTDQGWPVHHAPFCGPDYEQLIRSDHHRSAEILQAALQCVLEVLHQEEPFLVGLDFRLSNFAGDLSGASYIDTFPPLFSPDGITYHVFIPQPQSLDVIRDDINRKFDPRGTLRRLRFDCLSIDPALEPVLRGELARLLRPALAEEILDRFSALPDNRVHPGMSMTEVEQSVRATDPHDIDGLRELAARLVPVDASRQSVMERVFFVTRYPDPEGRRIECDPLMRHERLLEVLHPHLRS